jgi:hypothetical protein
MSRALLPVKRTIPRSILEENAFGSLLEMSAG